MLNVSASIIIPPNIPIDNPNKYLVPIPIGQLSRVLISFPYGAGWLVGVSLWYQNFPILPIHRDTWIKGNDYTFDLHSTRNLNQDPFEIEIKGYNLDTVFQHEILFVFEINERIGLSDVEKETLKFMSQFSEILITTEGEMGEISSPLHVSTKVLTRPDYMTGTSISTIFAQSLPTHTLTTRFTYTVPTGKRSFIESFFMLATIPSLGTTDQVVISINRNSTVTILTEIVCDNATSQSNRSKSIFPRIYLNEGDSIIIQTTNSDAVSQFIEFGFLGWEFIPTQ